MGPPENPVTDRVFSWIALAAHCPTFYPNYPQVYALYTPGLCLYPYYYFYPYR